MAPVLTNFSVARNGFRFVNRFDIRFPVKYPIPLVGSLDLSDVVFGLCGGMCFSALDYFKSGEQPPGDTDPAAIAQKLYNYLCERQLDSLSIPTVLKVIEWMLAENNTLFARLSRTEIPKLRRSIDRGEPAVLALVRVQGMNDPTQNHQVLAIGYDFEPASGRLKILLYDPNHPGEQPFLLYQPARLREPAQITQSTGEPLRGFFVLPYKYQRNIPRIAPPQPEAISFGLPEAAEAFRLQWPVDSKRVNQFFGENPDWYRPFKLPGHEGLDLYAPDGANIYAAADGEVYQANHPDNHPYGLQVRIRHNFNNKVYHTVYAHLSEVFVSPGETVKAGDRIALADNTGNSSGSHLHLTLKIDGERTSGYPTGIVDPWPYLKDAVAPAPAPLTPAVPLPAPSGVNAFTTGQVNLRLQPNTSAEILAFLAAGEELSLLGKAEEVRAKIGQADQWLPVQTASGQAGYVAAWFLQNADQPFPPSDLVIYPFEMVNLRAGPGTAFNLLASLSQENALTVLGDAGVARSKIGRQNEWIQVQTETGQRGFVAAWLVHLTGQIAPPSGLVVYPMDMVNIRARPAADGNILTVALPTDALSVLGDKAQALASIGQVNCWLNVQTPSKYVGYIAAWLVRPAAGPAPAPVPAAPVPAAASFTVYPTADINLRAQPSVNSPQVGGAYRSDALQVLDADTGAARLRLGKQDNWLFVQKKDGARGWAAAWFLQDKPA